MDTLRRFAAKPIVAAAAVTLLAGAFVLAAPRLAQAHDDWHHGHWRSYHHRPSVGIYVAPSYSYYSAPSYGVYAAPYYGGYSYYRPYFDRSQHRLYHGYWRDYGFGGYGGRYYNYYPHYHWGW
jgi:hypothetical protein